MDDDLIIWTAYGAALAGTGALLAGTLASWWRHPAHRMMFGGSLLSFLGILALLVVTGVERMSHWSQPAGDLVRAAGALSFFAGLLFCGPAFLWGQIVHRREGAQAVVERTMLESLAKRIENEDA